MTPSFLFLSLLAPRRAAPVEVAYIAERGVETAKLTPRESTISEDDGWLEAVANAIRLRRALNNGVRGRIRDAGASEIPTNSERG